MHGHQKLLMSSIEQEEDEIMNTENEDLNQYVTGHQGPNMSLGRDSNLNYVYGNRTNDGKSGYMNSMNTS